MEVGGKEQVARVPGEAWASGGVEKVESSPAGVGEDVGVGVCDGQRLPHGEHSGCWAEAGKPGPREQRLCGTTGVRLRLEIGKSGEHTPLGAGGSSDAASAYGGRVGGARMSPTVPVWVLAHVRATDIKPCAHRTFSAWECRGWGPAEPPAVAFPPALRLAILLPPSGLRACPDAATDTEHYSISCSFHFESWSPLLPTSCRPSAQDTALGAVGDSTRSAWGSAAVATWGVMGWRGSPPWSLGSRREPTPDP